MFFLKELPTRQMVSGYAEQYSLNSVDAIEEALVMMRQASLLIRELETYFTAQGTSQLRFLVLIVIDREPDRQSLLASEIAQRIDVSKPVLTRALQSLVNDGMIKINADASDGRAKQITLSATGKRFLAGILPGYFDLICQFQQKEH